MQFKLWAVSENLTGVICSLHIYREGAEHKLKQMGDGFYIEQVEVFN